MYGPKKLFSLCSRLCHCPHTQADRDSSAHVRGSSRLHRRQGSRGEFTLPRFCLLRCIWAHLWPVLSPGSSAYQVHTHPSPRRGAQTTGIITVKSSCGDNLRLRFHYIHACFYNVSLISHNCSTDFWSLHFCCYFLSVRPKMCLFARWLQ